MRRAWTLGIALAVLLVPVGCGGDSSDDDTASTTGDTADATAELTLTSSAFADGDPIPDTYAAAGDNESPPLGWSGVPADTTELAITMIDPDASNFVHWIVAGIDPETTGLEAGELPPGAVEALTSFGQARYGGPAPPPGPPHTYVFTLYALPDASGITEGMDADAALTLLDEGGAEIAELRGEYETSS